MQKQTSEPEEAWEDISKALTWEGRKAIKKGQILVFQDKDGNRRKFKVMSTKRGVWIVPAYTFTEEEAMKSDYLRNKLEGKTVKSVVKVDGEDIELK